MSIVVNIGTLVALKRSRDIEKGEAASKEGTVVWDFPLTISGMNIVGAFFRLTPPRSPQRTGRGKLRIDGQIERKRDGEIERNGIGNLFESYDEGEGW